MPITVTTVLHVALTYKINLGDFPAGPGVRTLSSNLGDVGLIPASLISWRAKISDASWPKTQNINNKRNMVTNSTETKKKKNSTWDKTSSQLVPGSFNSFREQ